MKTAIIVNLQVEGVHSWENCPIQEVAFLRNSHRHMFHIKVEKEVTHDDRDIEIIQFKRDILTYLHKSFYNDDDRCLWLRNLSCEQLAKRILNQFQCDSVQVLEDGENGAVAYV
jgi:hypothetical protein